MPGRGTIDPALWDSRNRDPARLRLEFQGPKARGWLMRWLPARAWENGIFAVFANNIGRDYDTIKPGLAMILGPDGETIVESHALGDDVVVGLLTSEAFELAPGRRYLRARRPELYGPLVKPHPPGQRPVSRALGWKLSDRDEAKRGRRGYRCGSSPIRIFGGQGVDLRKFPGNITLVADRENARRMTRRRRGRTPGLFRT